MPARRRPVTAALAAVVMGLAGCAGLDESGSGPPPGGSGDATDGAADSGLPLLQVQRSGGFVPMGLDFATVPELTVYADGQAITHGPQIAIYPPPALPNLLRQDLAVEDVDALVAAARDAGLLEEAIPDYGSPPVADAPTTFVTLHVEGRTYAHAAEALGIGDGAETRPGGEELDPEGAAPGEEMPGGGLPGLTEEHLDARAELAAFISRAHETVGATGEGEPYVVEVFAVMARPAFEDPAGVGADAGPAPADEGAAGSSGPAPDDGLERQVLPWPLDVALADAEDCVLVEGEDARTLRDTLAGASSTTLFEQDGVRYDAFFRPLLPHEEGCGDL